MKRMSAFGALIISWMAMIAEASVVVDQQAAYGSGVPPIVIGGPRQQIVAQTVTAGLTGSLTQVEIGVGCESGTLAIEIVDLEPGRGVVPGTVVRSRTTIDAALVPNPPEARTFTLDRAVTIAAGHRFAIVLRNETGSCGALKGPSGDSYPDGEGFFRSAAGPPDAWLQFLDFGTSGDLGFRTMVDVPAGGGRSGPCVVNGFATPFPNFIPVCRCLEDQGLRDQRCALFGPSFFLFRNLPFPIRAGQPFTVKWTLVAFAPMKGVVELAEKLPAGFQSSLTGPLVFFVDQLPAGKSITLEYKAVAGSKPGQFKVDTVVTFPGNQKSDDGRLQTVIEVAP
jgi:hypothetical protein